ncbi:hypothetical protein [Poritiphilus flavus]|uniref:Uncharacterized protein n=1 Tax=Poritiphilus flavus TaxID=2697053 RepID=A0A6L9EFE3_9FLAO|nr:hypothetical protein [Poritiphilus flavus]NAS13302.1 hypothetical protein [Poritiphilus flavus]
MKNLQLSRSKRDLLFIAILLLSSIALIGCSTDEASSDPDSPDSEQPNGEEAGENVQGSDCPESVGFLFEESNGVVSIEFENSNFPEGWVLKNELSGFSGDGYMVWEGDQSLGNPGSGKVVFPIAIKTTGTYRFLWKSSFTQGNDGTEHNDSWLRFPDANDFFGKKADGSVVYPEGSGKEPNPAGASSDGWFKIYRSGNNNEFKWQASTSDHDAHNIYVTFSGEGVYLIEISGRSSFHGIDRLLLFKEDMAEGDALDAADTFSKKQVCD